MPAIPATQDSKFKASLEFNKTLPPNTVKKERVLKVLFNGRALAFRIAGMRPWSSTLSTTVSMVNILCFPMSS